MISKDPRSGIERRHHVHEDSVQRAVRAAAKKVGISKRVTPHVLRHSLIRSPRSLTLRVLPHTRDGICLAPPSALGCTLQEPSGAEIDWLKASPPGATDAWHQLLGHRNVATTQIYTHVMNRPGLAVRSPLD